MSIPNVSNLAPQQSAGYSFFVGTYTTGESEGIYNFLIYPNGNLSLVGLAGKSENPSFIALSDDKRFLVAVNEINRETGTGTIESFKVAIDQLEFLSRRSSGGNDPCFVTIHQNGSVLTANYTGGNICLHKLGSDGILSDILDIQQHTGKGSDVRQDAPHAHSVWFDPIAELVVAIDLGTNELWFYSLDSDQEKLVPANQDNLSLDPAAGPRHLAFHPDGKWFYVVNELNSSVTLINRSESGLYVKGLSYSSLPDGYTDSNTCSDIHISSDGKFLYVANRGHDSIAVFQASFMDGSLTLLGHKSSGGLGPRNFALSPDENYLLIANQHSNNIVVLKRDKKSGLLKYKSQISAPNPTCIVF